MIAERLAEYHACRSIQLSKTVTIAVIFLSSNLKPVLRCLITRKYTFSGNKGASFTLSEFDFQKLVNMVAAMLTGNDLETKEAGRLSFRAPVADDGPVIHALVERCKPLDLNSRYCYLILCEHFSSTCVVVEQENDVVAVITAYIPPDRNDTLFVWQVAVDLRLRGQGLAKKMLNHLLQRHHLKHIQYVEATVNPSNDASRAIFKSLSKVSQCAIDETLIFPVQMFGNGDHEQENLIRVGPLGSVSKN